MSQQIPSVNGIPYRTEDNLNRRLFVETGFGFKEIGNSKGKISHYMSPTSTPTVEKVARIVEDYIPPSPSVKTAEIVVARAPSIIHSTGKSSYKIQLRMIFPSKLTFQEFIFYCGNTFKFYDERGGIYTGALTEQPNVKRVEAGARYDVSFSLICIRKESDDTIEFAEFDDIKSGDGYNINVVRGSLDIGIITLTFEAISKVITLDFTNDPMSFSASYITSKIFEKLEDEEYNTYYDFERTDSENILLKVKAPNYYGRLIVSVGTTGAVIYIDDAHHFAYKDIVEIAQAGIVMARDRNGNPITKFRPGANTNRAEGVVMINRLRKYVERMLRG